MAFKWDVKFCGLVKDVVEVIVVELGAEKRVSVHCRMSMYAGAWGAANVLPAVSGCRLINFFSATEFGVSVAHTMSVCVPFELKAVSIDEPLNWKY